MLGGDAFASEGLFLVDGGTILAGGFDAVGPLRSSWSPGACAAAGNAVGDWRGIAVSGWGGALLLLQRHLPCLSKELKAGDVVGDGEWGDVEVAERPLLDVDFRVVGDCGPVHRRQG